MRIRIILMLFLFPCIQLFAQPLSIGDSVPDIHFATVLNYASSKAKLSDFKGRLLILDFWATWCGSCLHAMPKMDSLQKQFPKDVKLLLVNNKNTGDDLDKVQAFFKRWQQRSGSKLNLTTVVNDTLTQNLFPHQLLPHYVWIGKNGRVLAITSSDALTRANILSALNEKPLSIAMKKDQNTERPIFLTNDLPGDQLLSYSIFLKGWYEGLPSGSRNREREGVPCGRTILNTSLLDIYSSVARSIDATLKGEQFVVITKDSSDLFPPSNVEERNKWYKQHAYSLDVVMPSGQSAALYQYMLAELNRNSGYEGKFEMQKGPEGETRIFVLRKR